MVGRTRVSLAGEVLTNGRYSRGLVRYRRLLGPNQIHAICQTNLEDPATQRDLFQFLGVDPSYRPSSRRPANRGTYDLRRLRWLRLRSRLAFSWDRSHRYTHARRRWRRPVGGALSMAVVGIDRAVLRPVLGVGSPAVGPSLREDLLAHYADEVDDLEALLGLDLSAWRRVEEGHG